VRDYGFTANAPMKKILIVEDDQLVASAYKKRFQEAGYEVEWAPDGLEGIKLVSSVRPEVVLLDLLMPRLDGIEVLKYIRSHPELNHLPVVVFSNSYMTNLVENAWRAGADQCLMKASTTPAQLFDAVNKAIQKAAARKSAAPASNSQVVPPIPPVRPLVPPGPVMTVPPVAPPNSFGGRPFIAPVAPLAPRPQPVPQPVPTLSAETSTSPQSVTGQGAEKSGTSQHQVDPEFQAQIRDLFLKGTPSKLAAVREAATIFVQDQGSSMQIPLLADLFRRVHSLTGNAAVAGCAQIAHYASTFEAFLQELQQKPKFINVSTARTVMVSVAVLEALFQHADRFIPAATGGPCALVVDGDNMTSQAVSMALEKAQFQVSVAPDRVEALATLSGTKFDVVVMAVNLPGLSGFELCAQMQTLPAYAQTPVLFVTSVADFAAHAIPEVLGDNDIIAQPFLLIELTLKAVTHAEWAKLQR
jgi:CheY-like chemotaxis protein